MFVGLFWFLKLPKRMVWGARIQSLENMLTGNTWARELDGVN